MNITDRACGLGTCFVLSSIHTRPSPRIRKKRPAVPVHGRPLSTPCPLKEWHVIVLGLYGLDELDQLSRETGKRGVLKKSSAAYSDEGSHSYSCEGQCTLISYCHPLLAPRALAHARPSFSRRPKHQEYEMLLEDDEITRPRFSSQQADEKHTRPLHIFTYIPTKPVWSSLLRSTPGRSCSLDLV